MNNNPIKNNPQKIEIDQSLLSRVEVIGPDGREYVKYHNKITLSLQDDGKTLKIFLEK